MTKKMLCEEGDPFFRHYLVGGRPWFADGELRRIYFEGFSLRGIEWWSSAAADKRDGPKSFPIGYYDVRRGTWETRNASWTQQQYAEFMTASIERGTFAPRKPPPTLHTRDGVEMVRGLIVMFTGDRALGRGWGMGAVQGRLLVAAERYAAIDIPPAGKVRRYGNMGVPVREYASHAYPSAWVVAPLHADRPLVVESGNFAAEWAFLVVDPETQLTSIAGGGRRFVDPDDVPEVGAHIPKILVIA